MKRIRNAALLSALMAVTGLSMADESDYTPRHMPKELTRDVVVQRAAERFDRADLNHDGKLEVAERRAAREKARQKKAERQERVRDKHHSAE